MQTYPLHIYSKISSMVLLLDKYIWDDLLPSKFGVYSLENVHRMALEMNFGLIQQSNFILLLAEMTGCTQVNS